MTTARERAYRLLGSLLDERGSDAPPAEDGPEEISARDERLAAELAHGVVRHLTRIDWAVARAADRPVGNIMPPALAAARIALYQILFTPSVPRYAAVSESVALTRAHAPKAAGFVNWLLRRVGADAAELPRQTDIPDAADWMATFHSIPPWLVRRWVARLGAGEAERLCAAMNEHPPPHVRVSPLRADRESIREELAGEGFTATAGRFSPAALHVRGQGRLTATGAFAAGAIYLQDESSQLAALALAPRAGERVLDACAGLGGKATQCAEIAGDGADVVAVDTDRGRLAKLGTNAARLGLRRIRSLNADLLDAAALAGERFDAVLVDAPCSALGTIPRHPELKWSKRPSDPRRLAALQGRLLARAAELTAPGGRLVYSTCTTEPEEGEELVAAFLAAHPPWRVEPPPRGCVDNAPELLTTEGFLRAWPHRHGIGGAFVALLRRGA
jgi:16S rRNA (cytosine967-C5)-methyltransferase